MGIGQVYFLEMRWPRRQESVILIHSFCRTCVKGRRGWSKEPGRKKPEMKMA